MPGMDTILAPSLVACCLALVCVSESLVAMIITLFFLMMSATGKGGSLPGFCVGGIITRSILSVTLAASS